MGNTRAIEKRVISLGAGVQSSTMALMAAHSEIGPMPDCAVFADTQWEPDHVYKHLEWLKSVLPFPVITVTAGNIKDDIYANRNTTGQEFSTVPWYTHNGKTKGMGQRQCTNEYKIKPITQALRSLLGLKKGERVSKLTGVEVWIGISTDEAIRMKPSQYSWQINRWPLIDLKMSRQDCLDWVKKHNYPMPDKSSCLACPYRSDNQWIDMKKNQPDDWQQVIEMDHHIRFLGTAKDNTEQYVHSSCIPLDQIDFDVVDNNSQLNLFNNECEGMCGV